MARFKAIVIEKQEDGQKVELTDFDERDLMEGEVTVGVEWSRSQAGLQWCAVSR
jgi:acrylyl-CoA reductase (NADPH)